MSIYNYLRIKTAEDVTQDPNDPLFIHQRTVEQPWREAEVEDLKYQNDTLNKKIIANNEYVKPRGHLPGFAIGSLLGTAVTAGQLYNASRLLSGKPISMLASIPSIGLHGFGGYTLAKQKGVKSPWLKTLATLGGGATGALMPYAQAGAGSLLGAFLSSGQSPGMNEGGLVFTGTMIAPLLASVGATPALGGYLGDYYGNKLYPAVTDKEKEEVNKSTAELQKQLNKNKERINLLNSDTYLYSN